ncbi:MAG: Bax inhibitor-1/YccA family protein [Campylobacteraceae bacterium]|jgi:modulator of FtsH protease|nr:Bax inhibitor-1/YccA family protein [Campylobacteraceae bacterium]
MALYDRDYANEQVKNEELGQVQSKSALSLFIKKTYQLFAASLLAGSVGAYVGLDYAYEIASFGLWALLPWIGTLIALHFAKRVNGLNYVLLFAFTLMGGLIIAPVIASYLSMGAGQIVVNAFILTTVAFGGLSIFAMNTKINFSGLGKFLFIALLVLIAASVLHLVMAAFGMASSLFYTFISAAGAIIFSIYILYDTQNIIKGAYETPIEGAIALYLDFLNLFLYLLRLLGIFSSDD